MSSAKNIDMCRGPILRKMALFVFPLICTYALQTFFNAVDMAVVGRFASHQAMAAVGVTLNPVTLILKILIGLSTGANAVIAVYCGARDMEKMHRGVHTAMAIAIYGGLLMTIIAIIVSRPLLLLMKTPPELMHDAVLYMRLYFLGIPLLMIFNFGCAVLRAVGDAKRPMYYLLYAGALNVFLNLLFVIVFKMSVAGVAIATTISNALAAFLIMRTMMRANDGTHLDLRKIRFYAESFKSILHMGIPAGVNSTFFNIANMVIQTSLNTFGAVVIAGACAASTIESFVSMTTSAFQQMEMTFVAQNYGAKNLKRVIRCCWVGILFMTVVVSIFGWGLLFGGEKILLLFTEDKEVIRWGMVKMQIMLTTLSIGGVMDLTCGSLRGVGYSVAPAAASLMGACVFRILWVWFAFPHFGTLTSLILCFPISWVLVSIFNVVMLVCVIRKLAKDQSFIPAE